MSTSSGEGYHHGDLRSALLQAAIELLEEGGETFSLRAVARRAGVSAAAPYRHYADKDALESAVATAGFHDLKDDLTRTAGAPASVSDLAELGVAYVRFALRRPAVFRLMFGNACGDPADQRVLAAGQVQDLVSSAVASVFPEADALALATAGWSLVHGLAFLHLDGKLPAGSDEEVSARVRSSVEAILTVGGDRAASASR
ncbi:TetR/AcrR family transcriptional regulator [Streptomyces galilaeus]